MTQYRIRLTKEERDDILRELNSQAAVRIRKLEALLLLDQGEFADGKPKTVAGLAGKELSEKTLRNLVKAVCEDGIDRALERKAYDGRGRTVRFDEAFEAKIAELASGAPPEGVQA